jgi:hypothetical protein
MGYYGLNNFSFGLEVDFPIGVENRGAFIMGNQKRLLQD